MTSITFCTVAVIILASSNTGIGCLYGHNFYEFDLSEREEIDINEIKK